MSTSVLEFPTAPLAKNVQRHFNELLSRMQAQGMTREQMRELLVQSLTEIGAVEIDGVWQMPPDQPT